MSYEDLTREGLDQVMKVCDCDCATVSKKQRIWNGDDIRYTICTVCGGRLTMDKLFRSMLDRLDNLEDAVTALSQKGPNT